MKIGFFDVDGTVVRPGHEIPSSAVCAKLRALQNQMLVCLCSGRSRNEIGEVINSIGLKPTIHIFGHGGFVLETDNAILTFLEPAYF